jgi:hypothetical protein
MMESLFAELPQVILEASEKTGDNKEQGENSCQRSQ